MSLIETQLTIFDMMGEKSSVEDKKESLRTTLAEEIVTCPAPKVYNYLYIPAVKEQLSKSGNLVAKQALNRINELEFSDEFFEYLFSDLDEEELVSTL